MRSVRSSPPRRSPSILRSARFIASVLRSVTQRPLAAGSRRCSSPGVPPRRRGARATSVTTRRRDGQQWREKQEPMTDEASALFEILSTTRAMRRLKPDPIPDELLRRLLQAGAWAANSSNAQQWRFLVVRDPEVKRAVQVFYQRAFDEVIAPHYRDGEPPPGVPVSSTFASSQRSDTSRSISTRHPYGSCPVSSSETASLAGRPARRSTLRCRTSSSLRVRSASGRHSRPVISSTRRRRRRRSASRTASTPTRSSRSATRWGISVLSGVARSRRSYSSTAGDHPTQVPDQVPEVCSVAGG